jgi:ribosome-associated translation inhibitor RaiA
LAKEKELQKAQECSRLGLATGQVKKQYGFVPDPSVTPFRNAVRLHQSGNVNSLPMPSNMAFHDLTPTKCAPRAAKALLGLGSKFIPTPKFTTASIEPSTLRFQRDFFLKVIFAIDEPEEQALAYTEFDKIRSKLYVKSKWEPTELHVPNWACLRLSRFINRVSRLFKKMKATSNLLPYQERIMESLLNDPNLLFPLADKGLGPCAVSYDQYIEDCLIHLKNQECYSLISERDAKLAIDLLEDDIEKWLKKYKHQVDGMHAKYILKHMASVSTSPFGQFYVLYKIHKGMKNGRWPTRPVCSDVSSLTHGLGKWVNEMLTPVQKAQQSYFQDSFELKKMLDGLELPPNARLFTADATSMYTNIKTEPALAELSEYLREKSNEFSYPCEALIEALDLVFRNNYFKFGDLYCKQISGTAMGTPPAPPYATVTYGRHEDKILPRWTIVLMFHVRFIDDVLGIWLLCDDPLVNDQR